MPELLRPGFLMNPRTPSGPGVGVDNLLLESGENILLESGDVILLE